MYPETMTGNWNLALFNLVHGLAGRDPFLDAGGIFLADTLTYLLAAGMLAFVLLRPPKQRVSAMLSMLLAYLVGRWVITFNLHHFLPAARPFAALHFAPLVVPDTAASFPSGHMSALFAVSVMIWYRNRRWGTVYFLLSALVGAARVYVGVHWPVDILAGSLVGLASGFFAHALTSGPAGLHEEIIEGQERI